MTVRRALVSTALPLVLLVAVTVGLTACFPAPPGRGPESPPDAGGAPPPPTEPTGAPYAPPPPGAGATATLVPGITDLGGGRTLAQGWLTEVDLEGGTWLLDSQPSWSSAQHATVVVVVPGKVTEEQFENLRGTFVGMEGTLSDGPSIRMAGPELLVDAVRVY